MRITLAIVLVGCGKEAADGLTVDTGLTDPVTDSATDPTDTGTPVDTTPNLAFVTSAPHDAAFGGLAGADAFCQASADAAGLDGTYRAWLSTASEGAATRFAGASGWVRVDGKPVAGSLRDLGAGSLLYPLVIDENGADVGLQGVFTNTTLEGASAGPDDCAGFTSAAADLPLTVGGYSTGTSLMFENAAGYDCDFAGRLYCLGVDRPGVVTVPEVAGARTVFQRLWTPGGGLRDADAACQADADAAGLGGTFRALLATDGASALSRFDLKGAPWVRVDGPAILPAAVDWSTATQFDTGPNVSADGLVHYGNYVAWGGAATLTSAGTAASTCDDWTNPSGTAMGGVAGTSTVALFFSANASACSFGGGLVTCMEE